MRRLLNPFRGFISYVLTWQNFTLSFVMLAFSLGVSLNPHYYLAGVFSMWGAVLVLLRNPSLREAIVANASTVPLSDKGFELVAAMQSTDQSVVFLRRIIASLRGKVLDTDDLRRYAAFSTLQGKPMKTYAELCEELRVLGENGKMVSFLKKPYDDKTLVKWESATGEISSCKGKSNDGAGPFKYSVLVKTKAKPHEIVEKDAGEFALRTDLRWLGSPTALALIPDSVETTIMGFLPTLDSVKKSLLSAAGSLEDLFGWKSSTSLKVCIALFSLSIICFIFATWIGQVIFGTITVYVFFSSTVRWTVFFNQRRATKLAAGHEKHNGKAWGFLKDANSMGLSPRSVYKDPTTPRWRMFGWCGLGNNGHKSN